MYEFICLLIDILSIICVILLIIAWGFTIKCFREWGKLDKEKYNNYERQDKRD
jgi:hypothetical protein